MKEPKLLISIACLLLVSAGCAHQVTPEEIRAKSDQAAARGRDKFGEELVQKNVTWYVVNGQSFTGFDRNSGLPEQLMGSGTGDALNSEFARGHNEAVLEYIANNGIVPGSFKPWENNLFHQAVYFDLHADQKPATLRPGVTVTSPGGDYTLLLQKSGTGGGSTSGYQVVVSDLSGQHQTAPPAGASEASGEVLFGPGGSDLAFTRWPSAGGEPVYGAMNLRDGRWLVVQRGRP
jgi:hypothetical protein